MSTFTGWRNADGLRWCTGCQEFMTPDLFHRNRASVAGDGLQTYCKLCARAFRHQTYERNSEREKVYARAWQQAHPERTRITRRRAHRVSYRLRKLARETERLRAQEVSA